MKMTILTLTTLTTFFANCVRRLSVSIEDSELTRQNVVSGQIAYICAVL